MDGEDSGDDLPIDSAYNEASSEDGDAHASQVVQQEAGSASHESSRSGSPVQAVVHSAGAGVPGFTLYNHAIPSNTHLSEPEQIVQASGAPPEAEPSPESGDDSDAQQVIPTSQLLSKSLISSLVRKEAVSEAHSTTQQELKDQEENQKREKERGVDDSDDTGEATVDAGAPVVKKRPAKASGGGGASKKSKELPTIGEDRDFLSDTTKAAFSEKVFAVIGSGKAGCLSKAGGVEKKTHLRLFDLNYLLGLENGEAAPLKFEVTSQNIFRAMKTADPSGPSPTWSKDGFIEPFPVSCDLLLNGIDEKKTPSFVESLKHDADALNHVRAATVEIKRSNARCYSMFLRVKPMPPVMSAHAAGDNDADDADSGDTPATGENCPSQLLYKGLCKVQAENPNVEFLITVPKKTIPTLINLPFPEVFFTQKLIFHHQNNSATIKKVLGEDNASYSPLNFDNPTRIGKGGSLSNALFTVALVPEATERKRKAVIQPKVKEVFSKKKKTAEPEGVDHDSNAQGGGGAQAPTTETAATETVAETTITTEATTAESNRYMPSPSPEPFREAAKEQVQVKPAKKAPAKKAPAKKTVAPPVDAAPPIESSAPPAPPSSAPPAPPPAPPPPPPPASPAMLSASAAEATQLAFWNGQQQGEDTMVNFGIVPFPPPPGEDTARPSCFRQRSSFGPWRMAGLSWLYLKTARRPAFAIGHRTRKKTQK